MSDETEVEVPKQTIESRIEFLEFEYRQREECEMAQRRSHRDMLYGAAIALWAFLLIRAIRNAGAFSD